MLQKHTKYLDCLNADIAKDTYFEPLIAAFFVDMQSLGETQCWYTDECQTIFVSKGHMLSWLHAVYRNDFVSAVILCQVTFPGQPNITLGFSQN